MIYFSIVTLILIVDQLSKYIIIHHIALFESVPIISGVFNLTHVTNRGAAFSLFANVDTWWRHPFFIAIGLTAAGLLTYMYFRIREHAPVQSIGLALICGGALGNLLDRFRLGAVVDFIDLYWSEYHWPAFNIADSAICVGVGIFFVFSFIEKENNLNKRGD